MDKNISEKYLEILAKMNTWTTVSEWAKIFSEAHPDLLEKANKEALAQKKPTTGLRELAARISSSISRGAFSDFIEIDESERPRKIRFLNAEEKNEQIQKELEEDVEPITRDQKIRADSKLLTTNEIYRIEELENIISALNSYFKLDFELDHSNAILNSENPGKHHPNNLQILLKSHNRIKSKKNWNRFKIDEQIEYIKTIISVQKIVSKKMGIDLEVQVIDSIISRLKLIY